VTPAAAQHHFRRSSRDDDPAELVDPACHASTDRGALVRLRISTGKALTNR
jgi:hypothetical protein